MIAAIYARKSTDQSGVSDDQKSVSRQIDHAREYATRKGWSVDEASVFVDDGISGAEFSNRPGFLRLMNALKPKPPFEVLIMSEESRLGRESIETAYSLKQLIQAGVRVFFYMEDRERTLGSPLDKVMMSLTAFADELEREKGRQRTYDAMSRKARAGHVTGGACFGYRNVEVQGPDGRRSHVVRTVDDDEAAVVRRIFAMCAAGSGLTSTAKGLNEDRALCPRSQQGRPRGWSPSSVREVLYRELYRGVIVWNRTRKRDNWGRHRQHARPEEEWVRVPAEHMRIVSEAEWTGAHERLQSARARYLRINQGRILGRPPAVGVKYLLSGLLSCGVCGGAMEARIAQSGRLKVYACSAFLRRGRTVCSNDLKIPITDADDAVLTRIEQVMLDPTVLPEVAENVLRRIATADDEVKHATLSQEIKILGTEIGRLTEALASGLGESPAVAAAIHYRETRRAAIDAEILALQTVALSPKELRTVRVKLEERVRDWRGLLRKHVEQGHQLVRRLIVGRLVMTPEQDAKGRYYAWNGQGNWSRLLAGLVVQNLASPEGFEPSLPA